MTADSSHTFWDAAPQEPLDVLVIGGGIVGAGVARDAAMRGLRTGLIEQFDFASGTSSRSSRLLHGGIRYLSQGRVGLVHEASREKTVVHRIAPHLAEPLAFVFPTRKGTKWSYWKLAVGVKIYDVLCSGRNLGKSQALCRQSTRAMLPGLSDEGLTGAVRYYDGLTNDSRLVLDTLRSAAGGGAIVQNYVRFVHAAPCDGGWICELEQTENGDRCSIFTKSVVNATGPWSDQIPYSGTSLRLTKGVHLVVDASRLPIADAVVIAKGERILFAIPWGERVILGTTDTDYSGAVDSPSCDPEDVAYVLECVNRAFPQAELVATDVVSTWAGLRPLLADRSGGPSDISRRHEVRMGQPGWWDVAGGKLTTYRLMAEETVNGIVRFLGVQAGACSTAHTPLLAKQDTEGISGILPPNVSYECVQHYCRNEWATHLDDVMIRRTSWRHYQHNHLATARTVASWMAEFLQWNGATLAAEIARYERLTGVVGPAGPHFHTKESRTTRPPVVDTLAKE